jgi:hypothetical protein
MMPTQACRAFSEAVMTDASPIPILAPAPLHGDAGRIAHLDPCAGRAGSIGTVNPLGNDALSTEPARIGEHGRTIFGYVFVEKDAGFEIAQQLRQRSLAVKEWESLSRKVAIKIFDAAKGLPVPEMNRERASQAQLRRLYVSP